MRATILRALLVSAVAVVPLAVTLGTATAADTTVGGLPTLDTTCGSSTGQTLLQVFANGDANYRVPSNGVITSVSMGGDNRLDVGRGFRLFRSGNGEADLVGSTPVATVPAGQVLTQAVRIPTQQGDYLGQFVAPQSSNLCTSHTGSSGDDVYLVPGDQSVIVSTNGAGTVVPGYRISVAVRVEPDADGDGYGDTTQDQCPTQAATHGPCAFSIGSVAAPGGRAKVGKRLVAPALALPGGSTESFQWFRVVKVTKHHHARSVPRAIAGARGSTYRLRGKDRGTRVYVRITVAKPGYVTTTVTSPAKRVH